MPHSKKTAAAKYKGSTRAQAPLLLLVFFKPVPLLVLPPLGGRFVAFILPFRRPSVNKPALHCLRACFKLSF